MAIGKDGSGTQRTTKALLTENGIPQDNWVHKGSTDAVKAIQANEVQAIFLVAPVNDPMDTSKPHPDVYALISDPNLVLHATRRAAAYVSRLPHLSIAHIGEGLIDLEKNYPPEPVTLLSPMATLVCRQDFDVCSWRCSSSISCREIERKEAGWRSPASYRPGKV